jgi:hypothetical protein
MGQLPSRWPVQGFFQPSILRRCSLEGKKMDKKPVKPDRSKINLEQPHELKYWKHALDVSEEQIRAAIEKVGNSAAAVRKELGLMGNKH